MSDIERIIPIYIAINEVLSRQSMLLTQLTTVSRVPRSEEELWLQDYRHGQQRVVQAIHDLALKWGAYCYED